MVEFIKSKKGYFYKKYKNNKIKRISEEEYLAENIKLKKDGNIERLILQTSSVPKFIELSGPFIEGKIEHSTSMDRSISIGILQREYGVVNNKTEKKIIGSYDAEPCIILCMRNRETNETMLSHIDMGTLNPLNVYSIFTPEKTDVYIVGGNNISKKQVHNLLIKLKKKGFQIKFSHIIDNESNKFAINCMTGETYLNREINIDDLPAVYNKNIRNAKIKLLKFKKSELNKVFIK
jgi:hypothetical protein